MKMQEHLTTHEPSTLAAAPAFLLNLLPAGVGAAIMVGVDMPKTKTEGFWRFFVAFGCSYLFGETLFDFLDTTSLFGFLDAAKHHHRTAVDGFVGASGYFVAGGVGVWLRGFKRSPLQAVRELRKAVRK